MTNLAIVTESETETNKAPAAILLKASELQAVSLAMGDDQSRYYLCGVFFEQYTDGTYSMAATDGHRMHSLGMKASADVVQSFILPDDAVKQLLALEKMAMKTHKSNGKFVRVQLTYESPSVTVVVGLFDLDTNLVSIETGRFSTKAIDGTYPDYRCIIPTLNDDATKNAVPVIGFDTDLLDDFGKASKLLRDSKTPAVALHFTGDAQSPAIVKIGEVDSFLGVIMPYRVK